MKATKCSNRNIGVCIQPKIIFYPVGVCNPVTDLQARNDECLRSRSNLILQKR